MATVLIVDDEELSRIVLRKLVTRLFPGTEIAGEAENGRLAIELAESLDPDIILMDIKIPVINGLDAAARIRESRPDTRIIIFSAFDSFGFAQRALNLGLSGYLLKPVREEEFVALFAKALDSLGRSNASSGSAGDKGGAPGEVPVGGVAAPPAAPTSLQAKIGAAISSLGWKELSLDRTAEVLDMSPQYLSRIFKDLFGMKFVEYITLKKIEAAKEMLRTGTPTVSEVCNRLGWSDTAHFARLFKEQTGYTPKAWAQAFREGTV